MFSCSLRRFSVCLLSIIVIGFTSLSGGISSSKPLAALAFDNIDLIGFNPQPVFDSTDESDPTNTTFNYHYASPVDRNGTLTWYLSNNFPNSQLPGNWTSYFSLTQSDGTTVSVSNSDFTYSHTKLSDSNPSNPLTLYLSGLSLKASTSYVIRFDKGYQYKNGSYSTTNSVFTFTTAADSATGGTTGGTTGGGAGGGTVNSPIDTTITGTAATAADGTTTTTAKITADQTNTSTVANVVVNLGTVTVTAPSSVFSGALGSADTLQLSQTSTPSSVLTKVTTAAEAIGDAPVSSIDVDLAKVSADGALEAVHNLNGNATVTIQLTDAQIARITDVSKAHLFYFDPNAGTFSDMGAKFDLTRKTVTFTTNHFSTFVIATEVPIGVTYSAHIQKTGWQSPVNDGAQAGTTGIKLRLEAVKINLTGSIPSGAKIIYQAHVQNKGWQKEVSNGTEAGTTGESLRLEAIRITLSGLSGYEVQYRAHVQSKDWMPWQTTLNGTDIESAGIAGTTGKSLRLEAIEIRIVKI